MPQIRLTKSVSHYIFLMNLTLSFWLFDQSADDSAADGDDDVVIFTVCYVLLTLN